MLCTHRKWGHAFLQNNVWRQTRCVLSPFLFVIVMDYILRQSSGIGVKISSRQISDLDFADDVFLLEEAKLRLQLLLDAIDEKAEKMGLAVNVRKKRVWPHLTPHSY